MNHVFIGEHRELILVTEAPINVIESAIKLLKAANNVEIDLLTTILTKLEYRSTWDNITAMDVLGI